MHLRRARTKHVPRYELHRAQQGSAMLGRSPTGCDTLWIRGPLKQALLSSTQRSK